MSYPVPFSISFGPGAHGSYAELRQTGGVAGVELSAGEARRMALRAQGLAADRPARPTARHVRNVLSGLGAVQLDAVNVLARAHYLTVYSRIGPYRRQALDDLVYSKRQAFEYWGHAASVLPVDLQPALRRSPTTLDLYRRQLKNHVLPALGDLRLGEVTTPRVDRVVGAVKKNSGIATAKTCRSMISGVMALAVRYGAVSANPVRDVARIERGHKPPARALTDAERMELA